MNREAVETLVRAILKVGGGALVAKGVIDDAGWAEASGAIITILGVVWGLVSANTAKKAKANEKDK